MNYGFADVVDSGMTAAGRADGDALSQDPYFIPVNVGEYEPAAAMAVSQGISYAQAQTLLANDPTGTLALKITAAIQDLNAFQINLNQRAQASGDNSLAAQLNDWNGTVTSAAQVGADLITAGTPPDRVSAWLAILAHIYDAGNTIASNLGVPTVSIKNVLASFPSDLGRAAQATLDATAKAVNQVIQKLVIDPTKKAAWGLTEILLIVGGGVAITAFLLMKSGVKAKIPGVASLGRAPRRRSRSRKNTLHLMPGRVVKGYGLAGEDQ